MPALDAKTRSPSAQFGLTAARAGKWVDAGVTKQSATVRLELESRPECVTLVRSVLSALGESTALDPESLDDVRTAVSEACNNVVVHAYDGTPGPLAVSLTVAQDGLEAVVEDRGTGIRQLAAGEDRMGVGLAVITALADRAEFARNGDRGTQVTMAFERTIQAPLATGLDEADGPEVTLTGDLILSLAPVSMLGPVLGRLVRAMAAASHFSVERFSDLRRITDEIAAFAEHTAGGATTTCAIDASTRRIQLTLAPLRLGSGDELIAGGADLNGSVRLADEVRIEEAASYELLRVVVGDRSAHPVGA
jgi:anti-sigma regulatory factor (Ser/Thr protein kinase)